MCLKLEHGESQSECENDIYTCHLHQEANNPCISVGWIGIHKDTHFMLVFLIRSLF